MVVFCRVKVLLPELAAAISIVPENAKPLGTVKLIAATVGSPKTTLEFVPETVQVAPMVGAVLFRILKI